MATQLETLYSEVDNELSTEWTNLSRRVRSLAEIMKSKTAGTALAADAAVLEGEVERLCLHLETIHRDVGKLLVQLDTQLPEIDFTPANVDAAEVVKETIQIHRENHELRADFKDIIKALFMWQDDPVERVQGKK